MHAHIIPNIVKISLLPGQKLISTKINFDPFRSKLIFVQEAKIQLIEKPQDMTELSTNYVTFTSFIDKNRVNVS